jgi:hypothetical protein
LLIWPERIKKNQIKVEEYEKKNKAADEDLKSSN